MGGIKSPKIAKAALWLLLSASRPLQTPQSSILARQGVLEPIPVGTGRGAGWNSSVHHGEQTPINYTVKSGGGGGGTRQSTSNCICSTINVKSDKQKWFLSRNEEAVQEADQHFNYQHHLKKAARFGVWTQKTSKTLVLIVCVCVCVTVLWHWTACWFCSETSTAPLLLPQGDANIGRFARKFTAVRFDEGIPAVHVLENLTTGS